MTALRKSFVSPLFAAEMEKLRPKPVKAPEFSKVPTDLGNGFTMTVGGQHYSLFRDGQLITKRKSKKAAMWLMRNILKRGIK